MSTVQLTIWRHVSPADRAEIERRIFAPISHPRPRRHRDRSHAEAEGAANIEGRVDAVNTKVQRKVAVAIVYRSEGGEELCMFSEPMSPAAAHRLDREVTRGPNVVPCWSSIVALADVKAHDERWRGCRVVTSPAAMEAEINARAADRRALADAGADRVAA